MQGRDTFQLTGSDMFDSNTHTQGGLPHLIQFLWDAYCQYLDDEIRSRIDRRISTVNLATAKAKAPATDFARFASDYLATNRVVDSFFIDENFGLRLTNNQTVAFSPGVEIRGTMQDSGAVQVTEGKSQPGNDMLPGGGTLRI